MTDAGAYSALADLSAPFLAPAPSDLSDESLLQAQRVLAEIRRRTDAVAAALAAEVAHRSRPELGYSGLAQRLGARTPETLTQRTTGISQHEAQALTRVGALLVDGSSWLAPVAESVARGASSVAAADAIRAGLGSPDEMVSATVLGEAAARLLSESAELSVEQLAVRARALRCELDLDRVADREQHQRQQRFVRISRRDDGMIRLSGLLDPEGGAPLVAALDAATAPRRGGPRFVNEAVMRRAQRIIDDPRSTEQLMADTLVDLVRLAVAADDGTLLGSTTPTVHILVTKKELDDDHGAGHIEGTNEPVSLDTVRRRICSAGAVPILFDGTQPVDLGRAARLYTSRQKLLIAARDGGCIFPGCDRPPSWSETHHIQEWQHGGRTDIRDGVLLCRHHHLLLHNNHWRCIRDAADRYLFVPPRSLDREQKPILAQKRAPSARKLALA